MNLISCEFCGIVINTNRINFEDDILDIEIDDPIFNKFYAWDNEEGEYSLILVCPCCESNILLNNGDKV